MEIIKKKISEISITATDLNGIIALGVNALTNENVKVPLNLIQDIKNSIDDTALAIEADAEKIANAETAATAANNAATAANDAATAANNAAAAVQDGKNVEIQVASGYIQWRLVGDATWINLISTNSLIGAQGASIELQVASGYIQWRVVGASTWTNLIATASLMGEKGDTGSSFNILGIYGTLGELQTAIPDGSNVDGVYAVGSVAPYTYYSWGTFENVAQWLSQGQLQGAKGDSVFLRYSANADGSDMTTAKATDTAYVGFYTGASASTVYTDYSWFSIKGDDGASIELQATGSIIQWRHEGDVTWTNLINIENIEGIIIIKNLSAIPTSATLNDGNGYTFKVGDMARVANASSVTGYDFYQLHALSGSVATWAKIGGSGVNTVTTLANLPVDKDVIYATLSAATTLSLAAALDVGRSITIICLPSAGFTQTLPTSGGFTSMDGSSLTLTSGKLAEISILCYATGLYSISSKVAS